MQAKDVFDIFVNWKDNEFLHFREKIEGRVEWIFRLMLITLAGVVVDLILRIVK